MSANQTVTWVSADGQAYDLTGFTDVGYVSDEGSTTQHECSIVELLDHAGAIISRYCNECGSPAVRIRTDEPTTFTFHMIDTNPGVFAWYFRKPATGADPHAAPCER